MLESRLEVAKGCTTFLSYLNDKGLTCRATQRLSLLHVLSKCGWLLALGTRHKAKLTTEMYNMTTYRTDEDAKSNERDEKNRWFWLYRTVVVIASVGMIR
eukprot:1242049-Amphidinium_carterae.2